MVSIIAKNKDDVLYVHNGTSMPKRPVCPAPKVGGKRASSWQVSEGIIEVVDDIDPETQEVRGKKAVVNAQKLAAYGQAQADKRAAEAQAQAAKKAVIQQLKQTGSDEIKQLIGALGL